MAFNYTCPFCSRPQSVTEAKFSNGSVFFSIHDSHEGHLGVYTHAIGCANPDCRKTSIHAAVRSASQTLHGRPFFAKDAEEILLRRLIPDSTARVLPDYIPAVLVEDYIEACRIRDLSPKASATLVRRCLQGMIRDFCNVHKSTLYAEITHLRELVEAGNAPPGVSAETVDAIDHVRGIGNIGAHMQADITI